MILPAFVVACALTVVMAGCSPAPSADERALPPAGGVPDYQLGGAYEPDPAVEIVTRDRTADPADGVYSICYVNAFQTQPGEESRWPTDVLLRDGGGDPVIDPAWPDEILLDTSSAASRAAIVAVVRPWIAECADAGFEAVEFDNLDTFARSGGALRLADNLELAASLVDAAHDAGLAAAQKNAAEHARELHESAGFDFAVAEECAAFDECDAYAAVYGEHVVDIEYTDALPVPFDELCDRAPASTVLRDRALVPPADPAYVFEPCAPN